MRRLIAVSMLMPLLLLAACAAPSPGSDAAAPEPIAAASAPTEAQGAPAQPDVPTAIRQRTKPAPPMSDPLPAERAPEVKPSPPSPSVRAPGTTGKVDASCKTDADCTVKNVGNCCGYYPACVNVNSPTDPAGVQAQCAKSGMASVCGFAEISACQCVQGQCQAGSGAVAR